MNMLLLWRSLGVLGILGLLVLIVVWNGWLTPVQQVPRSIEIAILSVPLLFFIRGVLRGRRNTFVSVTLLSFPYALIGIWYIFSSDENIYGYIMLVLSICLYFGGFFYARTLDKREKETGN